MSKTILITGASSGFGRDTAETLFRAGYAVYASMRGAQGKNRLAAEALRTLGIKTVELDVSDDPSVKAGVEKVLAEAGKIDVLVNNAGIGSAGVTEAFTTEQARVVFDTNVVGLLRGRLGLLLALLHRSGRITLLGDASARVEQRQEIGAGRPTQNQEEEHTPDTQRSCPSHPPAASPIFDVATVTRAPTH